MSGCRWRSRGSRAIDSIVDDFKIDSVRVDRGRSRPVGSGASVGAGDEAGLRQMLPGQPGFVACFDTAIAVADASVAGGGRDIGDILDRPGVVTGEGPEAVLEAEEGCLDAVLL